MLLRLHWLSKVTQLVYMETLVTFFNVVAQYSLSRYQAGEHPGQGWTRG